MVVNVSQSPYLFDESLQVCKFAAIASKVTIEVSKEPEPEVVVAAKAATTRNRQQSNFSMIVNKKSKESLLTGQGSIAWEQPQIRSTLCPMPDAALATISEGNETDLSEGDINGVDETGTDERYNGLLSVIEDLKNQLVSKLIKPFSPSLTNGYSK